MQWRRKHETSRCDLSQCTDDCERCALTVALGEMQILDEAERAVSSTPLPLFVASVRSSAARRTVRVSSCMLSIFFRVSLPRP